jgi:hypothetical protein
MKTKTFNEQQVIHEAMTVLLEHLEPAKVAMFIAARPIAGADYLELRERLFAGETVQSLAEKIRPFERSRPAQPSEPSQKSEARSNG